MKKSKICPYFDERALTPNHQAAWDWMVGPPKYEKGKAPTKKVKCPVCGRKVKQRISFCHDGCCLIYSMPRHRRKGWQKDNKTGSKDNRLSKRAKKNLGRKS